MFGSEMPRPRAAADLREQSVFERSGLTMEMLANHAKLGAGTRRAARVRVAQCELQREDAGLRVSFELPAGAYATSVLREIMKPEEPTGANSEGDAGTGTNPSDAEALESD
jgi:tRNA pseudouridine13 synthase